MKQEIVKNLSNHYFKRDRAITRANIKEETNDSKESMKCALYSTVKIEPSSLEISKCENSGPTKTLRR